VSCHHPNTLSPRPRDDYHLTRSVRGPETTIISHAQSEAPRRLSSHTFIAPHFHLFQYFLVQNTIFTLHSNNLFTLSHAHIWSSPPLASLTFFSYPLHLVSYTYLSHPSHSVSSHSSRIPHSSHLACVPGVRSRSAALVSAQIPSVECAAP
jgi:hypothetical protein